MQMQVYALRLLCTMHGVHLQDGIGQDVKAPNRGRGAGLCAARGTSCLLSADASWSAACDATDLADSVSRFGKDSPASRIGGAAALTF